MTIRVKIERIVVDAGLLPAASMPAMEAALGAELARLVADNPALAGRPPGAALAHLDFGRMTASADGEGFGTALAEAVNAGLAR